MAIKETHIRFIEKIKRTDSVQSFRFLPQERIDFIAGQFLQVIFDEQNRDNKELNKYLSFSSSPTKEYVEVTKRLSNSNFSQRLNNLKIGDEPLLKAPLGNCVFNPEYEKIGFLIGGIGITPVISIIGYIVDEKLNTDAILLYSNRTEEDIAFKGELNHWRSVNYNIKVIYTVTDCPPKDSRCIFGRINKELISQNAPDFRERIFFIFGPPRMVETMKVLCLELGCSQEKIKTESFIGY